MLTDYTGYTEKRLKAVVERNVKTYQQKGGEVLAGAVAALGLDLDAAVVRLGVAIATLDVGDVILTMDTTDRWARRNRTLSDALGYQPHLYRVTKATGKTITVVPLNYPGGYWGYGDGLDATAMYRDNDQYTQRFGDSGTRAVVRLGTADAYTAALQAQPDADKVRQAVATVAAVDAEQNARDDAKVAANLAKAEPIREAVEKVNKAFGLKVLDVDLDWQSKAPSIRRTSKIPNEVLRLALLGRVYEDAITKPEADAALAVVTTLDHEAGAVDDLSTDLTVDLDD